MLLHHLSLASPEKVQQPEKRQQHGQVASRQLPFLAVAFLAVLPPWPPFFRQTWNCPSVLNLILN
jgi:hypothetical protein